MKKKKSDGRENCETEEKTEGYLYGTAACAVRGCDERKRLFT